MIKDAKNTSFSPLSSAAWKQNIQFHLDGADYQTVLHKSLEGFLIKPFYNEDDLDKKLEIPPKESPWKVTEHIAVYDSEIANSMAREAVAYGAETLQFIAYNPELNIEKLLENIPLEKVAVQIWIQHVSLSKIEDLLEQNIKNVTLLFDPVGKYYCTGSWYQTKASDFESLSKLLLLKNKGIDVQLQIDCMRFQEAGASAVQQIAYGLAHATEYLHLLEQNKAQNTVHEIQFNWSIGNDYFLEIAKIRAFRVLWSTLSDAFGSEIKARIHSQPSKRYFTLYNSKQNLVRSSTACMAAALAGVDTLSNLPYDCLYKHPNPRSTRMARNQLLLLKYEAHFDKVLNPCEGSYYIESLTEQVAQDALKLFKSIEKGGGFLAQLAAHQIQKKIKNQHQKEWESYENKKEVLIGVHAYKNKSETLPEKFERNPFKKSKPRKTTIEPIVARRIASDWEWKRYKNE